MCENGCFLCRLKEFVDGFVVADTLKEKKYRIVHCFVCLVLAKAQFERLFGKLNVSAKSRSSGKNLSASDTTTVTMYYTHVIGLLFHVLCDSHLLHELLTMLFKNVKRITHHQLLCIY